MDSSSQDKNLPATAQRLKKAREDGNIPRSKDLSNLAVLGGGAGLLVGLMPMGFEALRSALRNQLHFDHQQLEHPTQVVEVLVGAFGGGLMVYLPLGLLMLLVAVGTAFVAGSWALSTKPITPSVALPPSAATSLGRPRWWRKISYVPSIR